MVKDVDDTPSWHSLLTTTPHQREDVSALTDLTCIAALHGGSLVYWDRTHDMPAMVGYLNPPGYRSPGWFKS
ncbi:hypothetical protein TNCV_1129881 [Trichonephila clavipes]|nr:hypothetical protein TNCV_1129881 [Trichonephila clavipes]